MFFDLVLGHKARASIPTLRRIVEHIVNLETLGVGCSESIELLLKKNILKVDIGVDEAEPRLVFGILQGSTDDLQHGRNAGTARNHTNLARQRGGVLESTLRATNADLIANLKKRDVARNVALFI